MISSNKWGARKLSYATYFENPKSRCDYNKVIGAKSVIGSILKFLSVKQLSVFGNFIWVHTPPRTNAVPGNSHPELAWNLQA